MTSSRPEPEAQVFSPLHVVPFPGLEVLAVVDNFGLPESQDQDDRNEHSKVLEKFQAESSLPKLLNRNASDSTASGMTCATTTGAAVHPLNVVSIPKGENEYMETFQTYFADGVSLESMIEDRLNNLKGIESVGIGFSTEKDSGTYWPVIRVIADENTCQKMKQDTKNMTLTNEVTAALKEALTQLHPSTAWNEEELKNTIEIVINYPLKMKDHELLSAGDKVRAKYFFCEKLPENQLIPRRKILTGKLGYSVCHKVTISAACDHNLVLLTSENHYQITTFHSVIPNGSLHFRCKLYKSTSLDHDMFADPTNPTRVKYGYINESPDSDIDYIHDVDQQRNEYKVATLLQATLFPHKTKNAFKSLEDWPYLYVCYKPDNQTNDGRDPREPYDGVDLNLQFVTGKWGLVKQINTTSYLYGYKYNNLPYKHPCNVDIAVLKYRANDICHNLKESFPNLKAGTNVPDLPPTEEIIWCGPPLPTAANLYSMAGIVVYIKNGEVNKLSDWLIKWPVTKDDLKLDPREEADMIYLSGGTNPNYPVYVWDLPKERSFQAEPGDSGGPVFLLCQDKGKFKFHLLGSLITAKSASPVGFSLETVRDEIAINHIDQILAERMQAIGPDMIEQLKHYKEYLMWHSKEQSLTPLIKGRYICCELSICTNPHQ